MQIKPRKWNDISGEERDKLLSRSQQNIEEALEKVRPVVEKVRTDGDEALVSYTRTFDKADISGMPIEVQPEEFERAETSVPDDLKRALEFSIENVRRFHQHQISEGQTFHEIRPGILAGEKPMPVDSAGLYVPRGRGSFPSMLYMLAVPASVAGVPDIAVATPPGEDGSVDPACLYAARLCGVNRIYRVGGAQAVAALAYGTASVQPVHKIIGPGSMYVAAAKRIVGSVVDTGLPAGPSESAVLADGSADPESVAVDLLIESEHGSDSSALLVTPSEKLAGRVADILPGLIDALPEPRKTFVTDVFSGYGGIVITGTLEEAAELVNKIAPEHLQLRTRDPFDTLSLIRHAGEILMGDNIPFSAANYSVGANAVLPTGGTARTFSAVSVRDFIKYSSVVYCTREGLNEMSPHVITLADYEGFPAHAAALRFRKGK